MPPVYGDSLGQLTVNAQRQEQLRQAGFQSALNTIGANIRFNRSMRLNEDQAQFQQDETARLANERERDRATHQKESKRRFLLDVGSQTMRKEDQRLRRDEFNFRKTQTNQNPAMLRLQLDTADIDAQEGAIEDEADFVKKYPSLPVEMAGIFVERSRRARPILEAEYNESAAAAELMNEYYNTQNAAIEAEALAKKANLIFPDRPEVNIAQAGLPALKERQRQMQQIITASGGPNAFKGMVYFDPKARKYTPAIPPPRWMNSNEGDRTAPIDRSRPAINNADGTISTERTITVEADGKHYLIPTIISGRQVSPDDAVKQWKAGGNPPVGVFNSEKAANDYATKRSSQIGSQRGQIQYEPEFYTRVNQLIESGLAPAAAKAEALRERADALGR